MLWRQGVQIKNQKDFFSGAMFIAAGLAFAWGASTYQLGEGALMGPGYVPLMLGVVLTLIGAVVLFTSLVVETEDGGRIGAWAWRPLFFIVAANLVFGMLLDGLPSVGVPAMGMIAAIYALTFVSSLADTRFRIRDTLILATVLAAGCYVAFIWLLKLQLQVWPSFVAG
ncbi:MAG: tripartite tricarboxylate transporter TctB family protein [Ramlibacter sp.]